MPKSHHYPIGEKLLLDRIYDNCLCILKTEKVAEENFQIKLIWYNIHLRFKGLSYLV